MSRPTAVLGVLAVLSVAGGVALQRMHTANRKEPRLVEGTPANPSLVTSADAANAAVAEAILGKRFDLKRMKAQLADLETLNRTLRADLSEALQGRLPKPGQTDSGPSGEPGSEDEKDPAEMTTAEAAAEEVRLREAREVVYQKMDTLYRENEDLKQKLDTELLKLRPAPKPEEIAARVAALRGLPWKQQPAMATLPAEELRERIHQAALKRIPDSAAAVRERAMRAIGFITRDQRPFDWRIAMADLVAALDGGFLDPATNTFYSQAEASLLRSDSRDKLAGALFPALLVQNFPQVDPLRWLNTDNDDEARAVLSVLYGDAAANRVTFNLEDAAASNFERGGAPVNAPPRYSGPPGLLQMWDFQANAGTEFHRTVKRRGGMELANKAYSRLPRSTSEILHPDSLYLAEPPFAPVDVRFTSPMLAGAPPIFTNVAGEYGIYTLFRTLTDEDYAIRIAEGWHGDRYLVFDSAEGPGREHVVWRSVWTSAEHSAEFFQGMRRWLMSAYHIPWRAALDKSESLFAVDDPRRTIRLRRLPDERTVVLINATATAAGAELDTAFGQQ